MLFERFEDDSGLAHYSYLVGCPAAGTAAVVDPRRDVDVYLEAAEDRDVRIDHVLETHVHADYASGARELAERTDAPLHLSAHDEGELYEVAFPHEELADGDTVAVGSVRLEALYTPGHTPEHVSFLVYDESRSSDVPELLLSGDFLFVGSLGRPDLLGDEVKRGLAKRLHASVNALGGLPDGLEVHPAHGAGSMCGSGMGGRPMSTLGFERIANPYLDPDLSEEAFVEKILGSAPPFPPYYRRMKELNSAGPPVLNGLPGVGEIDPERFAALADSDHVVVDLRDQLAFGGAHLPGAFGIGADGSVSTWAAWVVPYDTPILFVARSEADVEHAARALVRVGLDDVRGHLAGGIEAWRRAGLPLAEIRQMDVQELHGALSDGGDLVLLDVRTDEEWDDGHLEGAIHVHGGFVVERLDEIPDGRPVAVMCDSGYRSTVAASVLRRHGFDDVRNVPGGMTAWEGADLPVVHD